MLLLKAAAAAKRIATTAAKTDAGAGAEKQVGESTREGKTGVIGQRKPLLKRDKNTMVRLYNEYAEDAEALAPGLCLASRVRSPWPICSFQQRGGTECA
jgi:hypothetical protein